MERGIEGVVTGLSYEQRGINYEKIGKKLACLASPSQDLFLDYQNFKWIYNEVAEKSQGNIKYCIIGMDFYRLWYDLSLSQKSIRMLCFYNRLRCVHHYHDADSMLLKYEEDIKVCEEIMIDNYMRLDYQNSFHPERFYGEITEEYGLTDEIYQRDKEEVKKVFDKPYPLTFDENIGILNEFLKFLNIHDVKTMVYIPPFPRIFNEYTSPRMKEITEEVLFNLKEKYEFEILDLSNNKMFNDKHFADWCHLNSHGANLATQILNAYMDKIWE